MKLFRFMNDWSDMGYITGMALAGILFFHWTYCIIFIWSIIITLLMRRKAKNDASCVSHEVKK